MTFFKTIILGSALLALAACSQPPIGQRGGQLACSFGPNSQVHYTVGAPSDEVVQAVEWIISLTGGEQNFTVRSAKFETATPIAFACQADGKRYVVYDEAYFHARHKVLLFSDVSILAHEILHHTAAHVSGIGKDSHSNELAADRFSGFIIASLGGTLKEAQSFLLLVSEDGSVSHPPRRKRLDAVNEGWDAWVDRKA